jgi:hypothetical protein
VRARLLPCGSVRWRNAIRGDAKQQLDTAIDWGRYELFDTDTDTDQITANPA